MAWPIRWDFLNDCCNDWYQIDILTNCYLPSNVSLLHWLDLPPISAGVSSRWQRYYNNRIKESVNACTCYCEQNRIFSKMTMSSQIYPDMSTNSPKHGWVAVRVLASHHYGSQVQFNWSNVSRTVGHLKLLIFSHALRGFLWVLQFSSL
jgi:hypothetical protein